MQDEQIRELFQDLSIIKSKLATISGDAAIYVAKIDRLESLLDAQRATNRELNLTLQGLRSRYEALENSYKQIVLNFLTPDLDNDLSEQETDETF